MSKRSVPLHLGEVIQRVPLFFSTGPRACRIPADPTTDDHLRTRPDRARERIEWHEECLEAHANAERTPEKCARSGQHTSSNAAGGPRVTKSARARPSPTRPG